MLPRVEYNLLRTSTSIVTVSISASITQITLLFSAKAHNLFFIVKLFHKKQFAVFSLSSPTNKDQRDSATYAAIARPELNPILPTTSFLAFIILNRCLTWPTIHPRLAARNRLYQSILF